MEIRRFIDIEIAVQAIRELAMVHPAVFGIAAGDQVVARRVEGAGADKFQVADDDVLFELSHRSIFAAWKKAATLWILNNQTWTRSIGEFMRWFCYYDLWSKVKIFGDMFKGADAQSEDAQKSGPKNMLDSLDKVFNEQQLEALRISLGKSKEGTNHQLSVWKNRGFIIYSEQTGLYTKTGQYLSNSK